MAVSGLVIGNIENILEGHGLTLQRAVATARERTVRVTAECAERIVQESLRSKELCGFSGHRHATAFEGVKHRNNLGNCELGFSCVKHDQVRRLTDGETVIDEAHHLRRPTGHHVEALPHVSLLADLTDIRIEIRHADERAVAERCERVEHVVAR
jgi:hypothetical protein